MKLLKAAVRKIQKIKKDVYLLAFHSSFIAQRAKPGQFVHIKTGGVTLLRRPFSIHRTKGKNVYILFRVRGEGTQNLAYVKAGDTLDILGPLGNGFALPKKKDAALFIVAGGMGVAPMPFLLDKIRARYKLHTKERIRVLLGVKTKADLVGGNYFRKEDVRVFVSSEDKTAGFGGTVIQLLSQQLNALNNTHPAHIYACGPNEMLTGLKNVLKGHQRISCQVSFEQFMGCGIGICYGCAIQTAHGFKRVCKDGPVFSLTEI